MRPVTDTKQVHELRISTRLLEETFVTSERDKIRHGVSPNSLSGCTISARQFPVGSGPKPPMRSGCGLWNG